MSHVVCYQYGVMNCMVSNEMVRCCWTNVLFLQVAKGSINQCPTAVDNNAAWRIGNSNREVTNSILPQCVSANVQIKTLLIIPPVQAQ